MMPPSWIVLGMLLAMQAAFVGSTFDDRGPLWLAFVTTAVCVWLRQHRRSSRSEASSAASRLLNLPRVVRWLLLFFTVVLIVGSVALWRTAGVVTANANAIFLGVDLLAHASIFLGLAVWLVRPNRGHIAMLPLGMVVMLMCVAGGGVSQSLASQTVVGMIACIAFVVGSQVIGSSRLRGKAAEGHRDFRSTGVGKTGRLTPLFSMLMLSLFLVVTSAVANVTELVLPSVQSNLRDRIQVAASSGVDQLRIGGMRYVSGSRLGSIRQHLSNNPAEVTLRVTADEAPGYLRGTVFDLYRGKRWYSAADLVFDEAGPMLEVSDEAVLPLGDGSVPLSDYAGRPLRRFALTDTRPTSRTASVIVRNDATKGQVIFLPLHARFIEASSSELTVSRHRIVRSGVDVSKPYVAIATSVGGPESLSPIRREILLDIPDTVETTVRETNANVIDQAASPRDKAASVERFFASNFDYEINQTKAPGRVDPLAYFLESRHAAHCEYFASATVMMLRSAGVPARYVTGYVADEVSEDDDKLWYARNRDAHAWVEAFDDETGQWFAVESTPGRRYLTLDPDGIDQAAADSSELTDQSSGLDNVGWLSAIVGWILSIRVTDGLFVLFRWIQWPLFIGLLYIWWTRFLRPQIQRGGTIDQLSRKRLRQVDRKVAKWSLVRQPTETLYQFADRVDASTGDLPPTTTDVQRQLRIDAASYYRRYADARYQGELPAVFGGSPSRHRVVTG